MSSYATAVATLCCKLGSTGPSVFPIGLRCMLTSGLPGAANDAGSLATIHAAIEAGVNLLDISGFHSPDEDEIPVKRKRRSRRDQAPDQDELPIARVLRTNRYQVVLSVTFDAPP